ncbi:M20/M25/M40 family metallo-hydrolase [Roseivirga echinicomitans]|uniref:Peptidase M20 n=1 Tax=Roseivirga echinicomitans TaxID=296218 RepID=A0A150X2A6_9BACT|nr:M20/M25/M40 family metallo-hydrolase [Roseivirga echinicomitans]KYG72848.1 peptidase M20 [Roseivirga echinicomitans]
MMKKLIALLFVTFLSVNLFAQKAEVEKAYTKEIKNLTLEKQLEKAFQVIDELEAQSQSDLVLLTEIEAPPFKETKRALKYKEMLEEAGADRVWIDEVGNVLALKKGTKGGRTVALDAHLDTVFPEGTDVKVKYKGDTMYAPGIGDDTRGLVVVLTTLRALNKAEIQTEADLLFVGTVGEEGLGDLRGVRHLFEAGEVRIDSWISIDGGSIGRVNNQGLGSKRYKAIFKGPGGHSWGAFGLGNPHHAIGKAIDYFTQDASKFTAEGPRTSFNVGRMGGGTSVNSIPFESWMEVDMRSVSPDRLNQIDKIFKDAMNRALVDYNNSGIKGEKLTLVLEQIGDRPSGELATSLALVQRSMAATEYFGEEPSLTRGSTNSNIPIALGIPAVTLGRGGVGSDGHSLTEWWLNKNGADAIKLALLVTVAEAGLDKNRKISNK